MLSVVDNYNNHLPSLSDTPLQNQEVMCAFNRKTTLFDNSKTYTSLQNMLDENICTKEQELGEGSFGTVYKITAADSKNYILKQAKEDASGFSQEEALALPELFTLGITAHPNLLQVHAGIFKDFENNYSIALTQQEVENKVNNGLRLMATIADFIDGNELYEDIFYTDDDGNEVFHRLSNKGILNIAIQVAKGMQAMHNQKTAYIDLKPENIMISSAYSEEDDRYEAQCTATIIDFGSSRAFDSHRDQYKLPGSLGYLAPELSQVDKYSDTHDIWSFASLLTEMLTGNTLDKVYACSSEVTAELAFNENEEPNVLPYLKRLQSFITWSDEQKTSAILKQCPDDSDAEFNKKIISLILACCKSAESRPCIGEVIDELKKISSDSKNIDLMMPEAKTLREMKWTAEQKIHKHPPQKRNLIPRYVNNDDREESQYHSLVPISSDTSKYKHNTFTSLRQRSSLSVITPEELQMSQQHLNQPFEKFEQIRNGKYQPAFSSSETANVSQNIAVEKKMVESSEPVSVIPPISEQQIVAAIIPKRQAIKRISVLAQKSVVSPAFKQMHGADCAARIDRIFDRASEEKEQVNTQSDWLSWLLSSIKSVVARLVGLNESASTPWIRTLFAHRVISVAVIGMYLNSQS